MKQIFLLPHQDDEHGIYRYIDKYRNKKDLIFIYLTTGAFNTRENFTRNSESFRVLKKFGIHKKNIIFLGHITKTQDQNLCRKLEINFKKIKEINKIRGHKFINKIIVPAWEGGHPDHDSTFLLGLALSKFYKSDFVCFPLYSSINTNYFSLFCSNPKFYRERFLKINITQIFKYLGRILFYHSQFKTFLILFPLTCLSFIINKNQKIFYLKKNFNLSKPHKKELFYEKRFNISFQKFMSLTLRFRQKI